MTSESENKKKLASFFDTEYHALRAYVNARIKSGVDRDPEDIIQDVALKLFSGADRYTPISNVAGFVYHSIKNKLIDVMRSGKTKSVEHDENEVKLIDFAELLYGSSANAYSEEMMEALKKAILELKTAYRDIIIAVDFEGYSYRELAIETGIPEGTLMSRRHRAMAQLHTTLKQLKEIHN